MNIKIKYILLGTNFDESHRTKSFQELNFREIKTYELLNSDDVVVELNEYIINLYEVKYYFHKIIHYI